MERENMKKYEEEHYLFENIKENIYPWITGSMSVPQTLNEKRISEKDTPLISFAGDLMVVFVIKRGEESYEVLKDSMLPPEIDIMELYHTACENLVRDVEFVISNTMYGAFGILADGFHETSALCLKHIWNVCVEKLQDDLLIMVPARDTIVFAAASQEKVVEKMLIYAEQAYERSTDKISMEMFVYSKEERELLTYEKTQH